MTQLDIPPISFARYVDLLKRRRWQVIPTSILGLVIGGLVAFLIPRYYVAETRIQYKGVPGDEKTGTWEDPMAELVDAARLTIPFAVEDTLRDLDWLGAVPDTRSAIQDHVREVRTRVSVQDMGPNSPRRSYAMLRVSYRDTNGERAAGFLNRLVDNWITEQLDSITERADQALSLANARIEKARNAHAQILGEISDYERQHGLNPQDRDGGQQGQTSELRSRLGEVAAQMRDLERQEARLELELEGLAQQRDRTPKTIPASQLPRDEQDLMDNPQFQAMAVELQYALAALSKISELHPNYELRVQQVEELTRRLDELRVQRGAGRPASPTGEVSNPAYEALVRQIEAKTAELEGVQGELAVVRRDLRALERRLEELPDIWRVYNEKLAMLEEARTALNLAQADGAQRQRIRERVTYEKPLEVVQPATVPQKPTEPNITLVALVGCVIGLGAAIGLILLIDFLQGTFKTVEEVERGLGVPVLGGFAYLETEEVRARATRTRRTVVFLAGSFVLLVVVLVTIYYVDATRLPGFVRDALSLILGEAGG